MPKRQLSLGARFRLGLIINTSFMAFEFMVGLVTGSLALVADAAHNLTDSVTLVISWIAERMSKKPADSTHTLGHGRIGIMAALINGTILMTTAAVIFFEAYQRFIHPLPIQGGVVAATAFVGIVANGAVALLFRRFRSDLNVKAAYLNMAFDMLFSIAAMVAGFLILITHQTWIDAVVGVGIGVGLLYAAFGIVRQATNIFLEGVPRNVNIKDIRSAIRSHPGVKKLSRLYVWAIDSNDYAACCIIRPSNKSHERTEVTRKELEAILKELGFNLVIIEIR
jgi:cobalt-zinc-cadmium efflux system protein